MGTTERVTRRQFMKIVAMGGAAAVAYQLGVRPDVQLETVSQSRMLMGTIVNLTAIGDKLETIQVAVDACLDHMQSLEGILSRFKPNSQLSELNRTRELRQASKHLLSLLEGARQISILSGGAFDITVKPLVDLYQECQARGTGLPSKGLVAERLRLVDFQKILVNGDRVSLGMPGMSVTLDGIAKGYIVDEGVSVLRHLGLEKALVEAGGDLMASGQKQEGQPWIIGLQSPRPEYGKIAAKFRVVDRALATSGDYIQSFMPDLSQHHIIDPRTGYSPTEIASATILARSAVRADALATAMMVMGAEEGIKLAEDFDGVEAYLVTKSMKVRRTSGFMMES